MASTVWKGHLTFGLVSIPIRLFRAARSEKTPLRQLYRPKRQPAPPIEFPLIGEDELPPRHGAQGARSESLSNVAAFRPRQESEPAAPPPEPPVSRIRQAAIVPGLEEPVPQRELVKGYEYEKDRYVVLEEDELRALGSATASEMQIIEFVRLDEIDPVYYETSYYVNPEEGGQRAYALLFEAMRKTGYVALAEAAMHRREHVMVLRPGKTGLLGHTMFYASEVRSSLEHRTDASGTTPKELAVAEKLIESLAAPFDPGKYKDAYREKLQALIDAKLEGRQVAAAAAPIESAPAVDILEALQKSLAAVRKPPAAATRPDSHSKPKRRTSKPGAAAR